jgi:hypothetical protein
LNTDISIESPSNDWTRNFLPFHLPRGTRS